MRRARGFTLIELLAALAVLAVLAALSFRGLASVLDAEAHVREEARRWNEVGLLLAQLRQDVSSAVEGRGLALGRLAARAALGPRGAWRRGGASLHGAARRRNLDARLAERPCTAACSRA